MNQKHPNNVGGDPGGGNDERSTSESSKLNTVSGADIAASLVRTQRRDVRNESNKSEYNRRNTFTGFPENSPVNTNNLARQGFYYFGFGDLVRCFSCNQRLKNLTCYDVTWHKESCDFISGQECGNIPILDLDGRIATFGKFPSGSPVSHQNLAEYGYFFTGDSDCIQCFSCEKKIENWKDLFHFYNLMGHNEGCTHVKSNSAVQTVPPPQPFQIKGVESEYHQKLLPRLHLNYEFDRLVSFSGLQSSNMSPSDLAKNGFFYCGISDQIQCFSCSNIWTMKQWKKVEDIARQHYELSRDCKMALGVELRNVPVPKKEESLNQRIESYKWRNLSSNPQMNYLDARLETFESWPVDHVVALPSELAEAGFYYTGERDRTKCWYCNGCLECWEVGDIPWVEHAKFFPHCEFVLRKKGQLFVYQQMVKNPALKRQLPCESIEVQDPLQSHQVNDPNSTDALHEKKIRNFADDFKTCVSEDSTVKMKEELERLEKKIQCCVCLVEEKRVLFWPCLHFCTCENCSSKSEKCPMCREKIKGRLSIYI